DALEVAAAEAVDFAGEFAGDFGGAGFKATRGFLEKLLENGVQAALRFFGVAFGGAAEILVASLSGGRVFRFEADECFAEAARDGLLEFLFHETAGLRHPGGGLDERFLEASFQGFAMHAGGAFGFLMMSGERLGCFLGLSDERGKLLLDTGNELVGPVAPGGFEIALHAVDGGGSQAAGTLAELGALAGEALAGLLII